MDEWMETTKGEAVRKQPARKIEIDGRMGGGRGSGVSEHSHQCDSI